MGRTMLLLTLLLVGLLNGGLAQPGKTNVTDVYPRRGSLMGGTYVWVEGTGLDAQDRDELEASSSVVYLGTTPCDIIEYDHTSRQIKCETRPRVDESGALAPVNNLEIQVYIITPIWSSQIVATDKYDYRWDNTPVVEWMKYATTAGSTFRITGDFRGCNDPSCVDHHSIKVGAEGCEMLKEEDDRNKDPRYGLECKVYEEVAAGRHTIEHKNQDTDDTWSGYGRAYIEPEAYQYDVNTGEGWHVTIYPEVTDVLPPTSGKNGGDVVEIHGTSFPSFFDANTSVSVTLDGVTCEVTDVTFDKITCTAGPSPATSRRLQTNDTVTTTIAPTTIPVTTTTAPEATVTTTEAPTVAPTVAPTTTAAPTAAPAPAPITLSGSWKLGPRGIPVHVFEKDNSANTISQRTVQTRAHLKTDGYNYGEESVVYFIPPVTGKYSFYSTSDDSSKTHLSMSNDLSSMDKLTEIEDHCRDSDNYWYHETGQISSKKTLTANTPYLMRIEHTQHGGGAYFRLAARIENVPDMNTDAKRSLRNYKSVFEVVELKFNQDPATKPWGIGGSFRLDFNGQSTEMSAGGIRAWKIANKLRDWGVKIADSWDGKDGAMIIRFGQPGSSKGNSLPAIQIGNSINDPLVNCTVGSEWSYRVREDGDDNDVFLDPVPADYFRVAVPDTHPVVEVRVNGMLAAHLNEASMHGFGFTYDAALTPSVTTISSTTLKKGDPLTLTLTNMGTPALEDVTVTIGTAPCDLSAAPTGNSITCTMGVGAAGSFPLHVLIKGRGIADVPAEGTAVKYVQTIDSVSPTAGPEAGGTSLVIEGSGFQAEKDNNSVLVGGQPCVIQEVREHSRIVCLTPAGQGSQPVTVNAASLDADSTTDAGSFTFDPALTSVITSIEPRVIPSSISKTVIISGSKFRGSYDILTDKTADTLMSISFGNRDCRVLQVNATTVLCRLKRAKPTYGDNAGDEMVSPLMVVDEWGYAKVDDTPVTKLDTSYEITSVNSGELPSGSLYGGSKIVIAGKGFAEDPLLADYQVMLVFNYIHADVPEEKKQAEIRLECEVTTATSTLIECTTPSLCDYAYPTRSVYTNGEEAAQEICERGLFVQGAINVNVNGIKPKCKDANGCEFKYAASQANELTSISPKKGKAGDTITLTAKLASGSKKKSGAKLLLGESVEASCADVSHSGDQATVTCTIPQYPASQLPVTLWIEGDGYAKDKGDVASDGFLNELLLTDIKPRRSSMEGGRIVTLTGEGFSTNPQDNIVEVGDDGRICEVVGTPTHTTLQCKTPTYGSKPSGEHQADIKVHVVGQDTSLITGTPGARRRLSSSHSVPIHPSDKIRRRLKERTGGVASRFLLDKADLDHQRHSGVDIALGGGRKLNTHNALGHEEVAAWTQHAVDVLRAERSVVDEATSADGVRRCEASATNASTAITIHNWHQEDVASRRRRRLAPETWPADLIAESSECGTPCHCKVTYANALTPELSSVAPTTGTSGTELVIKGSGLKSTTQSPVTADNACSVAEDGVSEDDQKVIVGGEVCTLTTTGEPDGELKCNLGETPAGDHIAEVYVGGKGLAWGSRTITSELSVTALFTAADASVAGGQLVTVTGKGFSKTPAQNKITVCGLLCEPEGTPTYTESRCRAPAVLTTTTMTLLQDDGVQLPKVVFPHSSTFSSKANQGYHEGRIFDNDPETYGHIEMDDKTATCRVGIDMGGDSKGYLTNLAFWPPHSRWERDFFKNGAFQYSDDGTTWTTFLQLPDARPQEGWNEYRVRDFVDEAPVVARYFWYQSATYRCSIHDIKLEGHVVAAAGDSCPATVKVSPTGNYVQAASTLAGCFTVKYSTEGTPLIESIQPKFGSSLGGDTVTITGTRLTPTGSSAEQDAVVKFNGVECTVTGPATTSGGKDTLTCTTKARDPQQMQTFSTDVLIKGRGQAMVKSPETVFFRYLDKWSDVRTWKDFEEPAENDFVVIPDGQAVLLDMSPPKLEMLLIHGMFVWDRQDLKLEATYIWVSGGIWELGTEAEPFVNNAEIILHGDKWTTIEMPRIGNKMLATSPNRSIGRLGQMDIHGKVRQRVWTFLAETALKGATTLKLREPVDWVEDERILVTSSAGLGQIEESTVLSSSGTTVTLKTPLKHDHKVDTFAGGSYGFPDTVMTCEVALLSRNIKIHGDYNSKKQKYGVHTMAAVGALQRFENAEVFHCGQQGNLGRYCTHFHLSSILHDGYVKANSIHHSFQRAVTIHGVWYAKITDNVAYDVAGHTIFVEDGAEKWNRIEGNLVALTRKNPVMLSSDMKPANFWQQIPTNYWRHNVAAGSVAFGFWFELTGRPTGPSRTMDLCPFNEHIGEFKNNSAHSSSIGLRIYPGWNPKESPCGGPKTKPQYLEGLVAYHNGLGVFHGTVGDAHHHDYRLVENGGALEWKKMNEDVGVHSPPHFYHVLAVGKQSGTGGRGFLMPQKEFWNMEDGTFVNYGDNWALKPCMSCLSDTNMAQGAFTYRFKNMKFHNSSRRVEWTLKDILWDLDGSLTDKGPDSFATPYYAFNDRGACQQIQGVRYSDGLTCTNAIRKVKFYSMEPRELMWRDMKLFGADNWLAAPTDDKTDRIPYMPKDFSGWAVPMQSEGYYNMTWASKMNGNFRQYRLKYSIPPYVELYKNNTKRDEFMGLQTFWDNWRDHFLVTVPAKFYDDDIYTEWSEATLDNVQESRYDRIQPLASKAEDHDAITRIIGLEKDLRNGDITETRFNAPITELTKDMPFGTHMLPGGRNHNGTFAIMINTAKTYQEGAIKDQKDPFSFAVKARQCLETGCPRVTDGDWGDTRYPCHPKGGPQSGDPLVIPSTRWIFIDDKAVLPDTPFAEIDVKGFLEINEAFLKKDVTLKAKNMRASGRLDVDYRNDSDHTAIIELHGTDNDKSITPYAEDVWLGNKGMAIAGQLNLFGSPVTSWRKLDRTANIGDTEIHVQGLTQRWKAQDKLAIGSTEYKWDQVEHVTISGVSQEGNVTKVTLTEGLKYRHFAGVETLTDGNGNTRTVELRAPVGLLTRNVVVKGVQTSPQDVFGAHVSVVAISGKDADQGTMWYKYGHIQAKYAHFENMGKQSLPWAALNFEYHLKEGDSEADAQQEVEMNVVQGCSFTLLNYGTILRAIKNVRLDNNVYYRGYKQTVEAWNDAQGNYITNNMVVGTWRDPEETLDWLITYASFYLQSKQAEVSGNIASGSQDTGFLVVADDCGAVPTVFDNEVVGAIIGAWMWPEHGTGGSGPTGNQCKVMQRWTIWKAAHVGLLIVDTGADIEVNNVVVADSHIGISLNYVHYTSIQYTTVKNAILMGTTAASADSTCDTCLAFTKGDVIPNGCNSVFAGPEFTPLTGERVRRVGFQTIQKTNRAKTCIMDVGLNAGEGGMDCRPPTVPERMCSPPWERRCGVRGGMYAHVDFDNTVFAHFKESECGGQKAYAIAHNPTQPDYTPDMAFSKTKWIDTDERAKFRLDTRAGAQGCQAGHKTPAVCDAVQLAYGHDLDGTLLGQGTPGLFTPKEGVAVVDNTPVCDDLTDMGLKFCPDLKFRWFSVYSMDADSGSRTFVPMVVSRTLPGTTEVKEFAAQGMLADMCAKRMPFGLIQAPLVPNREYNITFLGTAPNSLRLHYMSPDPSEKILLNIFYRDPIKRHVFVNGQPRDKNLAYTTKPEMTDPHGANALNPQLRRFHIVMQGGSNAEFGRNYIDVRTTNIVQLNMKLDVPIADFDDTNRNRMTNNIATLLEIPPERIKVADVQPLVSRRLHATVYHAGGRSLTSLVHGLARRLSGSEASDVKVIISPEGETPPDQESYDIQLANMRLKEEAFRNNTDTLKGQMATQGMPVLAVASIPPSHCATGDCPPPPFAPQTVMMPEDKNTLPNTLGGTIYVTRAQDEAGVMSYLLRWGDAQKRPLQPLLMNIIADIPSHATGRAVGEGVTTITHAISNLTIPAGASYILAFTKKGSPNVKRGAQRATDDSLQEADIKAMPASKGDEKWNDVYRRYFSWVSKQDANQAGTASERQPITPKPQNYGKTRQ
ncbi:unnamed protein product [Vitrella brassicaformis CCMP3155]|uniref:Uncharacterized protein n=4 Tax=Vitrella brassicaformis TaxID=1169539 RepID=A0A0G4GKF3_VITBC|nr:unnamed protein product [Vitrella brassicaformis CCMP3155]|eukprot:CEM30506.1 unnamed protein product [Vitrella brassicaformis CCMP3155]